MFPIGKTIDPWSYLSKREKKLSYHLSKSERWEEEKETFLKI